MSLFQQTKNSEKHPAGSIPLNDLPAQNDIISPPDDLRYSQADPVLYTSNNLEKIQIPREYWRQFCIKVANLNKNKLSHQTNISLSTFFGVNANRIEAFFDQSNMSVIIRAGNKPLRHLKEI